MKSALQMQDGNVLTTTKTACVFLWLPIAETPFLGDMTFFSVSFSEETHGIGRTDNVQVVGK